MVPHLLSSPLPYFKVLLRQSQSLFINSFSDRRKCSASFQATTQAASKLCRLDRCRTNDQSCMEYTMLSIHIWTISIPVDVMVMMQVAQRAGNLKFMSHQATQSVINTQWFGQVAPMSLIHVRAFCSYTYTCTCANPTDDICDSLPCVCMDRLAQR